MSLNELMDAREKRAELMIASKAVAATMNHCRYAAERIEAEKNLDDRIYGKEMIQRIYSQLLNRDTELNKGLAQTKFKN